MRKTLFLIVGSIVVMTFPLHADPSDTSNANDEQNSAHLLKDEKHLEKMQAERTADQKYTLQAQKDYNKGTDEMINHDEQHTRDVKNLKSVETQVAVAKKNLKEDQQAMGLLLQTRDTLKQDIHQGDRLVHNEKTVLSVQKRDMDSGARYSASDDRNIQTQEKNIVKDQNTITAAHETTDSTKTQP